MKTELIFSKLENSKWSIEEYNNSNITIKRLLPIKAQPQNNDERLTSPYSFIYLPIKYKIAKFIIPPPKSGTNCLKFSI